MSFISTNVADGALAESVDYTGVTTVDALQHAMALGTSQEEGYGTYVDYGILVAASPFPAGELVEEETEDPLLASRIAALESGDVPLLDWESVKGMKRRP